jgi:hypothetical protein
MCLQKTPTDGYEGFMINQHLVSCVVLCLLSGNLSIFAFPPGQIPHIEPQLRKALMSAGEADLLNAEAFTNHVQNLSAFSVTNGKTAFVSKKETARLFFHTRLEENISLWTSNLSQAIVLIDEERHGEAQGLLEHNLTLAKIHGLPKGRTLYTLAQLMMRLENEEQALAFCRAAQEDYQKRSETQGAARSLALEGYLLMRMEYWREGFQKTLDAQALMIRGAQGRDFLMTRLAQAYYHDHIDDGTFEMLFEPVHRYLLNQRDTDLIFMVYQVRELMPQFSYSGIGKSGSVDAPDPSPIYPPPNPPSGGGS